MAYTYVGSAQNVSNGNTITYSPTAGNYLVVVSLTSAGGGTPTASIADNGSGTWTTRKATSQDGAVINDFFTVFTCGSAAAGVTTITLTFAGGTPGQTNLAIIEYSGLSATGWQGISAFNAQVTPGTGTNAVTSNAFTVTAQPALILGWLVDQDANGGWTAGTSPIAFTRRVNAATNMLEDARITATGSVAATATNSHGAADSYMSYVMAISEPVSTISAGFVASHGAGAVSTNSTPTGFTSNATGDGFRVTVVAAGGAGAAASPTITDTYNNVWQQIQTIASPVSNAFYLSRYWCQNANGGANHQFTATFGTAPSGSSYITVEQMIGGSTSALYTGSSSQLAYTSTTPNPFTTGGITVTPLPTNALLFAGLALALPSASAGTITEANGFTLDSMSATVFGTYNQLGYVLKSAASTYNASFSSTVANTSQTSFIAYIDAFNVSPPAGVAGPTPRCIFIMP